MSIGFDRAGWDRQGLWSRTLKEIGAEEFDYRITHIYDLVACAVSGRRCSGTPRLGVRAKHADKPVGPFGAAC